MELKKDSKELEDFIEASGLLEYNYETIAKIYRGNPWRLIKRIWQTLVPIALFLFKVGTDWILGQLKKPEKAKDRAREFTELLVELGPAFIKAGQALSTRPDLVPALLLDELAQLQDQLPGFDSELAMACIEQDLGKKIGAVFDDIENDPISAASLGQVHKGTLKGGQKVAVKVQRPGLREQITLDLYIVRNIAKWLKSNISFIRSDLVALIDELGKRVFEEMDYINEAENAEKFKSLHMHNKRIAVPKIYKEATSRRVLTMEWIEGVKLTNFDSVKKLGIDPNEMIEIGVNCSLEQLLEHGFFHADPHPGNLLALKDGRLCYLDFGMMSEVSRISRTGLIKAVVHLVNGKYEELSNDFVTLGFLSEKVDLKPIVPAFEKIFNKAIEVGVDEMNFKSVTDDMSGVMYKFPFKVPPYYALIIRSLITLEGIALGVNPNFKILGAAYPYFAKRLIEDTDPILRNSLKEMVYDRGKINWLRVEDLIKSASIDKSLNLENLLNDSINYFYSEDGKLYQEKLIEKAISKLDQITLKLIKKSQKFLNSPSKGMKKLSDMGIRNKILLELDPIIQFMEVLQHIPGFKTSVILGKIPNILIRPKTSKIGIKVLKGLTEKNLARILHKRPLNIV